VARLQEGSRSIVSTPAGDHLPQTRSAAPAASSNENRESYKTEVLDVELIPGQTTVVSALSNSTDVSVAHATVNLPPPEINGSVPVRPTLFIGVGGCGTNVVRLLLQKLHGRLGPLDSVPCLRILGIDTDRDELSCDDPAEDAIDLNTSQLLCIPLESAQYYRQQSDELTHWLSRRWIYNIPKSLKTEGLRPLGRLALVDHVKCVEDRLRREISAMQSSSAIATSTAALKQPVDRTSPRVFIIGSISRGTASGMVWDLVQLVRQILPDQDGIKPEVICVLGHWISTSAKDAEVATANACAALRELHHYMCEGCPGDPAIQLPALGRHHGLFNNVYLVDLGAHENPTPHS
jgi:hypothetical protein